MTDLLTRACLCLLLAATPALAQDEEPAEITAQPLPSFQAVLQAITQTS